MIQQHSPELQSAAQELYDASERAYNEGVDPAGVYCEILSRHAGKDYYNQLNEVRILELAAWRAHQPAPQPVGHSEGK